MAVLKLYAPGTALKAVEGHKNLYSGLLVRFGSPDDTDLDSDYFRPEPETSYWLDWDDVPSVPVLFEHGQHGTLGKRVLGRARLEMTPEGVKFLWRFTPRDNYERVIVKHINNGIFGLSSGSAVHLVERVVTGKAKKVTSWPIVEASISTRPAEWRNVLSAAKSVQKSIGISDFEAELIDSHREYLAAVHSRMQRTSGAVSPDEFYATLAYAGAQVDKAIEIMRAKGYRI